MNPSRALLCFSLLALPGISSCTPGDDSCGDGLICEVTEEGAECVEDPSECHSNDDCAQPGYECGDWRYDGVLFCWHPDSSCMEHLQCPMNWFCEDPEDDGIFECVDGFPDCRVIVSDVDCLPGEICEDPDGDGRGTCVPG